MTIISECTYGLFRKGLLLAFAIACSSIAAACISRAPPMLDARTAVIPGRATAGYDSHAALDAVLVQAAKMTVDHGFRYFRIADSEGGNAPSVRPGADVAIKVFRVGEVGPASPGIWDAQQILTEGVPRSAVLPHSDRAPLEAPSQAPAQAPSSSRSKSPRCTAYGCDW